MVSCGRSEHLCPQRTREERANGRSPGAAGRGGRGTGAHLGHDAGTPGTAEHAPEKTGVALEEQGMGRVSITRVTEGVEKGRCSLRETLKARR